jgi:tRNA pseudouridine55 synthase
MSLPDGLYPLYKYRGPSSNQFMMHFKNQHALKDRKIGYAGTLDPLAEGLLVIAVGRTYTKQLQQESDNDKEYRATIMLNGTTDSGDMESMIMQFTPKTKPTIEQVLDVCESYVGQQMQTPSTFSAKKVEGKRSYDIVRDNQNITLKACPITIHSIQVVSYLFPALEIDVHCSKGTYIRVLGQEIGKKLTGGGYLSKLVRTSSGEFDISSINWKLSPRMPNL